MNWKVRAIGQKIVASLPESTSYQVYDILQKTFGRMNTKNVNPTRLLVRTSLILTQIVQLKRSITGSTFLEVGTGWDLTIPIALWLCGAKQIITVDINPYLRADLVVLSVKYICQNRDSIISILDSVASIDCLHKRLDQLQEWQELSMQELMELMNIEYLSPADAANLPDIGTVDYHISHTVFEHIPRSTLLNIMQEACNVLDDNGLCVHFIDPSDHFAHRDSDISEVNFLQFSESQWNFWANNRYAYHNRLRVDDYENLFSDAGLTVIETIIEHDPRSLEVLNNDFPLAAHYRDKSNSINASTKLLIISQK